MTTRLFTKEAAETQAKALREVGEKHGFEFNIYPLPEAGKFAIAVIENDKFIEFIKVV